jgi:hypothetical protein
VGPRAGLVAVAKRIPQPQFRAEVKNECSFTSIPSSGTALPLPYSSVTSRLAFSRRIPLFRAPCTLSWCGDVSCYTYTKTLSVTVHNNRGNYVNEIRDCSYVHTVLEDEWQDSCCCCGSLAPLACSDSELSSETMDPSYISVELLQGGSDHLKVSAYTEWHNTDKSHISMPGFESMIPVFERSETIRILDYAATGTGFNLLNLLNLKSLRNLQANLRGRGGRRDPDLGRLKHWHPEFESHSTCVCSRFPCCVANPLSKVS